MSRRRGGRTRTVIPRKTSRETSRGCRAAGDVVDDGAVEGGDALLALAPDSRSVPVAPGAASSFLTSSYPPMMAGAVLLCLQHGGDGATPAPPPPPAAAAFPSAAIAAVTRRAQTDLSRCGRERPRRTSKPIDREREETGK